MLGALLCFPLQGTAGDRPATNFPIDLPTALRLAGAQNLDVQIAREQLKQARADRDSAIEQFIPWLSPGVGYHRRDGMAQAVPAGTVTEAHYQSYAPGGAIAAQVELGDAIYQSLAARQLVQAADHALNAQSSDAILAAAEGYLDLVRSRAQVGVQTESLRISREYQAQLHRAVAAGVVFKGDELRVQVQSEHYQIAVRRALELQRVTAARLAQVLHLDPSVELVPQESDLVPLSLVATNTTLDFLVQAAMKGRPELKRGDALIQAARDSNNGAVYGPLIPYLGGQFFAGGLGGGPDGGHSTFGGMEDTTVMLGWRIGPGGLLDRGRVNAARARLQTARLGREKVRDEVTRQVVESEVRRRSLGDQLEMARASLATASETLRLTQQRKEVGVGVVLENIQAQQELARARADYLDAVADFDKAQYSLVHAIGGLIAAPENSRH